MEFHNLKLTEVQEEQISFWLSKRSLSTRYYNEPKLQESTIETVKFVCHLLGQSLEIFITSVDILENYVHKKPECSHNCFAILLSAVNISNKLRGPARHEIKMFKLQNVALELINEMMDKKTLNEAELDILVTVDTLPMFTVATDVNMFLDYYFKNLKLRNNLKPLCMELLNIIYILRKKIFFQIKSIYTSSDDSFYVFKQLICNKFYYPGGIIACALQLTKFDKFLNVKEIIEDIANIAHIHYDHIQLLVTVLRDCIDNDIN